MTYYVDGFTYYGNPSPKGGGYTIFDESKLVSSKEILKPEFTNNEAELLGVLAAVELASIGDTIYTDSKVTMYWCQSGKPKARMDLKDEAEKAKKLIAMKLIKLEFVPREKNLAGFYNEAQKYL